jgi:hypothetical protein
VADDEYFIALKIHAKIQPIFSRQSDVIFHQHGCILEHEIIIFQRADQQITEDNT